MFDGLFVLSLEYILYQNIFNKKIWNANAEILKAKLEIKNLILFCKMSDNKSNLFSAD